MDKIPKQTKEKILEFVKNPNQKFHVSLQKKGKCFLFIKTAQYETAFEGFGAIFNISEVEGIKRVKKELDKLYPYFN